MSNSIHHESQTIDYCALLRLSCWLMKQSSCGCFSSRPDSSRLCFLGNEPIYPLKREKCHGPRGSLSFSPFSSSAECWLSGAERSGRFWPPGSNAALSNKASSLTREHPVLYSRNYSPPSVPANVWHLVMLGLCFTGTYKTYCICFTIFCVVWCFDVKKNFFSILKNLSAWGETASRRQG